VRVGLVLAGSLLWVVSGVAAVARADVADPSLVADYLDAKGTTVLAFGPDRRIFATEKQGRLVVYESRDGKYGAPKLVLDLSGQVNANMEGGMLGMALDPAFATNRTLYLFFTTDKDQRIVRVLLAPSFDRTLKAPEVVIAGFPREYDFHKAGEIRFDPSNPNALLVGLGDDNDRAAAQNLDRFNGKILRINKENGEGLPDNPFWNGDGKSVRSRVWALGMRNPFRFVFHPKRADVLFVSENGEATDRISRVTRGSNGGWNQKSDEASFAAPSDPNFKVLVKRLPDAQRNAVIVVGLAIAQGAPYGDPAHPNDYVLHFAEWRGQSFRYRLLGDALDKAELVQSDPKAGYLSKYGNGFGAYLLLGPDGALYATYCGINESDGDSGLIRIRPSPR